MKSDVIGKLSSTATTTKYVTDTSALLDEIHWCYNFNNHNFIRFNLVYTNGEQLEFVKAGSTATSYTCVEEKNLSDKLFTNACYFYSTQLNASLRFDYDGGSLVIGSSPTNDCTDVTL